MLADGWVLLGRLPGFRLISEIIVGGIVLARSVAWRVRQLSAMAGRMADGDLSVRIPATGRDELAGLERAFNDLAESLEIHNEELRESSAQLAASRARVVAAGDETRRRIEHELHDGLQQRLISLALELRAAEARVPPEPHGQVERLSRTAQGLTDAAEELREIARSVYPAILERGGLAPAVRAIVRRAGVPVDLGIALRGRLPQAVEVTAYYVVSEGVANAAKHAQASVIKVDVGVVGAELVVQVRDNGVGGADAARGCGLLGLTDRVAAVGGRMQIASTAGAGTAVLVTLPLASS